jgi:hypothetical protein
MAFGSNVAPKKKLKPAGSPWVCGCGLQMPHYIFFHSVCGKGQSK